jgi:tRNA-specific 2-thiouridylase
VLYQLGQEELSVLAFPIGEFTKAQVREKASALGLVTATKPESQEICFVADGSYRTLLKERFRDQVRPGPVVDDSGVVGEHDGIAMYTVGQRSGLRLAAGGPRSQPKYVSAIDPATNTVRVGGRDELLRSSCRLEDVRYVAGRVPAAAFAARVKVRSHAPLAAAVVTPLGDQARVDFDAPQRALAPGQAAVFYNGDQVIGGGPIATGDV